MVLAFRVWVGAVWPPDGALLLSPPLLSPHHQAAGAHLPIAVRLCTDIWRAGSHAARGSGSDVRAVWVLRRTPVWGGPLWEARSTAPRQSSLELGPRWSGWPAFPQESPAICRSANTHCHAGLASVMESPHPCVLGAVCTVGMPVPQPRCDMRNQVAGRSAGERSIMRSCVFLERQFCGFSIQPRLPASACRGHREGTRGEWQAVRGLWPLTLVDCKHQFPLPAGVSLVWKSFCPLMGTRLAVCASEWEWGACVPHPSITHHPH